MRKRDDSVKIILDVDPGHDDAVAILLAGGHPAIDLQAITVVAGNQTLEKTVRNTLNICTVAGILDVPIAAGMTRPIVRNRINAAEFHGKTGLDGPTFGEPAVDVCSIHAVDLIIEILMNSGERMTMVQTGPLTNLAMAIRREPAIVPRIERIVLMGGSMGAGNASPRAEFNIFADPEAASIVFTCGRPVVMMGLDVTSQAGVSPEVVSRIGGIGNKVSRIFAASMKFVMHRYRELGGEGYPPIHDPVTVAWLIDPSLVELRPFFVEVMLERGENYGRTLCIDHSDRSPNARVGIRLDRQRFWDLVYETYASFS